VYEVTAATIRDHAYGIDIPAGADIDTQLGTQIIKAEALLNFKVPTLEARVTAGTIALTLVQGVVCDMVLRVVKNPMSLRSFGVDDGQATIDNTASTGAMYLSVDEEALMAALPVHAYGAVRSIRLGVPAWRLPRA
jgi:hypothetical protein